MRKFCRAGRDCGISARLRARVDGNMAKAKTEYTVVARRYRPQQFDDLIGQEPVAQSLRNAITSGRVAHAYLFTGARGVGKTSAARILAKALNCVKGPTPTPCDECSSCEAIAAGDDIDVREIDGASNRGIDDVRAIRQDVSTRPTRGRYKIYIIDEVHMLTKESFNALLKTLEEPPPHVKFIFATTEVQKVPITILSRCQRFDFGSISTERITKQLRTVVKGEKLKADDDALEMIARRAGGSMRDGQSLLDQLLAFGGDELTVETVQKLLGIAGPERILSLTQAIFQHDVKSALEQIAKIADDGLQLGEVLDQLVDWWRDLMLVASAGKEVSDLNTPTRHREALFQQAASVNLDTILAGLDILVATKTRLRGSGHLRTLLQMAVIRLCRLEDLAPLSQIAYWLSQTPGSGPIQTPARAAASSSNAVGPPEAKKKADVTENKSSEELTAESLGRIWPEIVAQVGGILSAQLLRGGMPAIFGPNALVISFPIEYNAAYESCSNPQSLSRIEGAVRQRTGHAWTVRLEKQSGPTGGSNGTPGSNGPPAPPARVRKEDAMQQVPLLKRALEVFSALPVHLDPGFAAEAAPPVVPPPAEASDTETADEV